MNVEDIRFNILNEKLELALTFLFAEHTNYTAEQIHERFQSINNKYADG